MRSVVESSRSQDYYCARNKHKKKSLHEDDVDDMMTRLVVRFEISILEDKEKKNKEAAALSLRIAAYSIPKIPSWESENYAVFESKREDDANSCFRETEKKDVSSFHEVIAEIKKLSDTSRITVTTIIVDLSRIKSSNDIPTVEWKQFCQSIKTHSRNLISLKMIGPLNCFIGDARVEYNMNKYGFGARNNDRCYPSASKLKCLLMATPNLQRLHLERIGDCEEIFWEIRWLAPKLERLTLTGIDDPTAECHTTWFAIMHSLGKMDQLRFLSITNIVFYSDRRIDMLPAWECIRRCIRQMETLEQIRFEQCYSVHKPHGVPWPMGAKHLIQFSRQEQDELQYYVRRNLERRYKLVRLMAPEMISRTRSSG
jgi:hypothetical protein